MITKITLVLAMCLSPKGADVQAKLAELRKANPDATVTLKVDAKAQCANGKVIPSANKEAKILSSLK